MFCTIRKRERKTGEKVYNIYLSERIRVNGKIKSNDRFIVSLSEQEVRSGDYIPKINNLSLNGEEVPLILDKVKSIEVPVVANKCSTTNTEARVEIDILSIDNLRSISYKFYLGDIFVRDFLDVEFMLGVKLSFMTKLLDDELKEKRIYSKVNSDILFDKLSEIYFWHKDNKAKKEAEIKATSEHFTSIIQPLQVELAVARMSNPSKGSYTNSNITTDTKAFKKIYKILAKNCHPDNQNGSEELMQVVNDLKNQWGV